MLNVANGRSVDLLTLIDVLNRLLGTRLSPRHEPPRVGDVRESMADITLARTLLGYEPAVDFEEGLRRSIDYYRSIAERGSEPLASELRLRLDGRSPRGASSICNSRPPKSQ